MTGTKHTASTYDRMLAEIEMDSDDDDPHGHVVVGRKAPPQKGEAKPTKTEWERVMTTPSSREDLSVPLPTPRSQQESRSLDDERKADAESADDSDEEKETRVRHRDLHTFDKAPSPPYEPALDSRDDLRAFVTRALPVATPSLQCYVERDRNGLNRFNPVYRLFLDDEKRFLLSAQKRSASKTSNYLVSLHTTTVDRRSAMVVAKLRANWSGSAYTLFNGGLSPEKTAIDASVRKILGLIEFAYDEMGPGRLNVRIPNGSTTWKDREFHDDDAARKAFESTLDASALLLRNKRPHYDDAAGGHVLDFRGRVNMPSVKNFQMQSDAHGDEAVLQFGRVSCQPPGPHKQCKCHKDTFTMDLRHPLSPVQAFAVCLAAMDAKVADAKAFDRVANIIRRLSS